MSSQLSVPAEIVCGLFILFLLWFGIYSFSQWKRAQERASMLLRDILTPAQYQQLQTRGYVEIPSPTEPLRVYHVPRYGGTIKVKEDQRMIMQLCLMPAENLPAEDVVALHVLMIMANEAAYLQTANKLSCWR